MSDLTAKQKANNAILWIDRLSTTRVKQTKHRLGDFKGGYCCLGYGCKISKINYDTYSESSLEFQKFVGLLEEIGTLNGGNSFVIPNNAAKYYSLADLNDHLELSFRKISTQIKNNLVKLFEKDVAKILIEHYEG